MSKKKRKLPWALRFVQWLYPKLEWVFPILAYRLFIKLFFTPFNFEAPVKEKKSVTFGEQFIITAAGKKIQCYKWGTGDKVVLLIHGWAGRATQFRRFIKPLLAAGYQVIGFDGPAHGQSEGRTTNILEFEETLQVLYKQIGVPDAIIAHSFGGPVTLVSAMNGLPVKTVVTIASPTIGEEILNSYMHVLGGTEKTKAYFKKEVIKRTGKSFDEFSSLYAIQKIKQPVNMLLVYDEDDQEISMDHPKALMEVFPQAKLISTSGLGHNRLLKDSHVIEQIVTYIKEHTSVEELKSLKIV